MLKFIYNPSLLQMLVATLEYCLGQLLLPLRCEQRRQPVVIMVKQLSKFIAWDTHYFPCVRYVSVHSVHMGQGEDSHKDQPQDQ